MDNELLLYNKDLTEITPFKNYKTYFYKNKNKQAEFYKFLYENFNAKLTTLVNSACYYENCSLIFETVEDKMAFILKFG